jgi:hypothetical protein
MQEQHFSRTSFWRTIRKLKALEIITCGSSEQKGVPLQFTPVGRSLAVCLALVKTKDNRVLEEERVKGGKIWRM